jgi:hypothetical protein
MLIELRAEITAAIADVTKDILQHSCNTWSIVGMYAVLQITLIVKCFTCNNFSTCV